MKESRIYLDFLKRNILIFVLLIGLSLLINLYQYAQTKPQFKVSQSFRMEYSSENISNASAITDQAVTELRVQNYSNFFPGSSASIYKSGPFVINIDSISESQELSFRLLSREAEYLRSNFSVSEINAPQITREEPMVLKYLVTGLVLGGLAALTLALIKDYFKYY